MEKVKIFQAVLEFLRSEEGKEYAYPAKGSYKLTGNFVKDFNKYAKGKEINTFSGEFIDMLRKSVLDVLPTDPYSKGTPKNKAGHPIVSGTSEVRKKLDKFKFFHKDVSEDDVLLACLEYYSSLDSCDYAKTLSNFIHTESGSVLSTFLENIDDLGEISIIEGTR